MAREYDTCVVTPGIKPFLGNCPAVYVLGIRASGVGSGVQEVPHGKTRNEAAALVSVGDR